MSERVTTNGSAWYPVISPNGQFVAYVFSEGKYTDRIRLRNLKNGSVTDVAEPEGSGFLARLFFQRMAIIFIMQLMTAIKTQLSIKFRSLVALSSK